MATKRKPFDLASLARLPVTGTRYRYPDPSTPGLVLRVSSSGGRVFYWLKRVGSKTREVRIGPLEDFQYIDDVRAIAAAYNLEAHQGTDPAEQRRAQREAITFGELFALYLDRWAKARKRDWAKDEQRYKLHLKSWAPRLVADLERIDAVRLLEHVSANSGLIQANRVRALGHKVFRWAESVGLGVPVNPFAGTARNRETPKKRFLQPTELRSLWSALEDEPRNDLRDLVVLLLLTGVRVGSLLCARWVDFNLADRLWAIPAEAMKAGRSLDLPLAPRVVEILRVRKSMLPDGCAWVFPSPRSDSHLTVVPRDAWEALLKRAGIGGFTVHDLRRSHATAGLQAGVPIEVLGCALGHTRHGGVTAIYAQSDLALVRLAVEKTVGAILAVAEAPPDASSTVLAFPRPAWAAEAS